MRTRACALACLLALSGATAASMALAQGAADPMTEMARKRFQEGVQFYDQKKYEEARAAFLQAWALKHHPAVLLNLAQAEVRSNHPAEAARHFSQFLREHAGANPTERAEAERGLAEARAKIGRIQVSVPLGAEVFVDGELMGKAPLPEPVDVGPGAHTVEARKDGHTASVSVMAAVGRVVTASLSLDGSPPPVPVPVPAGTGAPPPVPPPPGTEPVGAPPPPGTAPPPADTGAQVSTEGREPFFEWFKKNKIAWVGAGVTGLGLVGGIGFGLGASQADTAASDVANQIKGRADADPRIVAGNDGKKHPCGSPSAGVPAANYPIIKPGQTVGGVTNTSGGDIGGDFSQACTKYSDNIDRRDTYKTLSVVSLVVAGVGAGGTVVAYFLTSKKKGQETPPPPAASRTRVTATVSPVTAPGFIGLAVGGTF